MLPALRAVILRRGAPQTNNLLDAEGDSISANVGQSANELYHAEYSTLPYTLAAIGGSGLFTGVTSSLMDRQPAVLAADPRYFSVHIFANDLTNFTTFNGTGPAATDALTGLLAYLAPIKAGGATIIVCTVLPNKDATFNTDRAIFNTALKAVKGAGIVDQIADYDPTIMGLNATPNDTTYYDASGVHPTAPVGYGLLYPNYRGAVNAARGLAKQVQQFTFTDVNNIVASTVTASNAITIQGLAYGQTEAYSVSSGHQVRKTPYGGSAGSWVTDGTGTVTNGDQLEVRTTSSATASASVNVVLTVGSISDTYTITTAAAGPPAAFASSALMYVAPTNSSFDSTPFTFASVPFAAGYPMVAVNKEFACSGVTVNGVALTQVAAASADNLTIWFGTAAVTASSFTVVVTGPNQHDGFIAAGSVSDGTTPGGTAKLAYGFKGNTTTQNADASVTIASNGIGINFAYADPAKVDPTYGAQTLNRKYSSGWRWLTFTSTLTPSMTLGDDENVSMLAVAIAP